MIQKQYDEQWANMVRELSQVSPRVSYRLTSDDRELIESCLGQEIADEEWKNLCELELDDEVL